MGTVYTFSRPTPDRVADLDDAERLILWACRYWVACYRQKRGAMPLLIEIFAANGVREAASSIDAVMSWTARAALRSIDVRCTACQHLSDDEALVLRALSAMQRREPDVAASALSTMVSSPSVDLVLGAVRGLASLLGAAGIRLPRRSRIDGDAARERRGQGCTVH